MIKSLLSLFLRKGLIEDRKEEKVKEEAKRQVKQSVFHFTCVYQSRGEFCGMIVIPWIFDLLN